MKLSDIKATNWSLSLNRQADVVQGIDEISQCIFIIVTTQKGTDPLRPGFGSDVFQYVDRPITEAVPKMIKAAIEGIKIWETRVVITKVNFNLDVDGLVEFTFEWTEVTANITSSTKVLINGTN